MGIIHIVTASNSPSKMVETQRLEDTKESDG